MKMECPRCRNTDIHYFGELNGRYYCRKCIQYGRIFIDEEIHSNHLVSSSKARYHLEYALTDKQLEISNALVSNYRRHNDSKVKAVCGAGKTEIVYEVILEALKQGHRVCFTTPRKELTKELYQRMKSQFSGVEIRLVCGGHNKRVDGQFIICTTHQLFRYPQAFDLLILDEMDAFPYKGDEVLENILLQSIRGNYIFMSATLANTSKDILLLTKRYHGHALPVPKCLIVPRFMMLFVVIKKLSTYSKKQIPVFLYVPTKAMASKVTRLLNRFHIRCKKADSSCQDISSTLELLKIHEIDAIVCTTILERGMTLDNVQVIVMLGQHPVYDKDTLIQISGRVGRKIAHPTGDVLILSEYRTNAIKECIQAICKDNA